MLERQPGVRILDIGCNDGTKTDIFATYIGKQTIAGVLGVDMVDSHLTRALQRGICVVKSNVEFGLPFCDQVFDVVISNQVIEHLVGTDIFVQEIHRVLKKGGYAVVATENLSYLCNIFSLAMGFQAFSQNISDRYHLGNPFSSMAGRHFGGTGDSFAMHKRVFSIWGLKAIYVKYGFAVEKIWGAGFSPFPSWFSRIDKIHARFIVVKARKF
jgi:SAM-dependent methyltransferase